MEYKEIGYVEERKHKHLDLGGLFSASQMSDKLNFNKKVDDYLVESQSELNASFWLKKNFGGAEKEDFPAWKMVDEKWRKVIPVDVRDNPNHSLHHRPNETDERIREATINLTVEALKELGYSISIAEAPNGRSASTLTEWIVEIENQTLSPNGR
jgi:hypothetical protein